MQVWVDSLREHSGPMDHLIALRQRLVAENISNGTINGTNTSVETFSDKTEGLRSGLSMWKMTVAIGLLIKSNVRYENRISSILLNAII